MSYQPGGGYPSLAEIRAWVQVAATTFPDEMLEVVAAAEQHAQSHLDWGGGDLVDDLLAAFYRRCARAVAAKAVTLGILGTDSEFGAVRLSRIDSEVDRLEAPYVVPVIA